MEAILSSDVDVKNITATIDEPEHKEKGSFYFRSLFSSFFPLSLSTDADGGFQSSWVHVDNKDQGEGEGETSRRIMEFNDLVTEESSTSSSRYSFVYLKGLVCRLHLFCLFIYLIPIENISLFDRVYMSLPICFSLFGRVHLSSPVYLVCVNSKGV